MYIGNDLQIAHPSYKIIDDISSGFNGSTTSFALQVSGETPVPFPISTQQVMISVNGVVQEPDPSGSAGFKLLGSNIVFSSAPANGHAFFGVINAGADYVTAGSEFPDGSATAPSFTFQSDQDTGWFRSGSGAVGFSANGVNTIGFDGNGLTVTGDASFVGDSSKNLLWDKSDGQLEFADNAKAIFGTGSDLKIFHNGTKNWIEAHNGDIGIAVVNGSEHSADFVSNGGVLLYYNNVKKFETTSGGASVTGALDCDSFDCSGSLNVSGNSTYHGNLDLHDNDILRLGTGDDLQIYHDGSNSFITNSTGDLKIYTDNFIVNDADNGDHHIKALHDGAVELYYDGVKTFETTGNGVSVIGPEGGNAELQLFSDEGDDNADKYKLVVDGSVFYIQNYASGAWESNLKATGNGSVEIYHDNSKKFETYAHGILVTGSIINSSSVNNTGDSGIQMGDGTRLGFDQSGTRSWNVKAQNGNLEFGSGDGNGSLKVDTVGGVSDQKGNLRSIPQNTQGSAYTLVAADAGKHILASGAITVQNSTFAAGDAVTIVNNTGGDIAITKAINDMYFTNDGSDASRTLATRGMATILFVSSSTCYISGAGLS